MNKIQMHKELCKKLNKTYAKKNEDYGDSFGRSFAKRGIAAAMTRMEDKWNRLDNLTLNPENIQVKDESIEDTLIDLANYCLMTCIELEFAKKNIQKENIPVKSNKEKKAKRGTKPPIRTLPANFTAETVVTTGESNE